MKKYKPIRVPIEAYNGLMNKKNIMQEMLKESLKKPIRFTMADTLRFVSSKKIFIYNDEILDFIKNKKNKRIQRTRII